ncbi:glutamate racemase [Sediminibacillus albus]|uniref:Glutamate racemase n=1 Tax=Sediminibacillus albus TaxID=407036 RepID=A0A1G9BQI4_9BACI|nr:glutamate racemase [Sediminibacillus albus]SDK41706.1 glutamate racemase [Sediminibacillus albus]
MDQPIGVIDSGVGGLTVARELMRQLPREELVYLGDTLRCPYGPRTEEEVIQFTWEMVDFLMNKKIKMLVVACNTATAFALEQLQRELPIPVIGVIQPGARAAIKSTQNLHIGVIGTEGTIKSEAYPLALKNINANIHINALACPRFVPMVEQGVLSGEEAYKVVSETLVPLKKKNHIDTLILGCTHYPLLRDTVQKVIGEHVTIISSGEETAREVSAIMGYQEKLFKGNREPQHKFYTTGEPTVFETISQAWLEQPVSEIKNVKLAE